MRRNSTRCTHILATSLVAINFVLPSIGRAESDPALNQYLSANGLLSRGLYELAVEEYREFLSEHPDHEKADVARYGFGVSLFRLQRYEDAVEVLSPLAEQSKFEFAAEVGTVMGQCYLVLERYGDAANAFSHVVRRQRDHVLADDAAAGWIEALNLDGKHDAAIDKSQDFVKEWPDSPLRERVEFFGGLSALAVKKFRTAGERFSVLLERFPDGAFARQASLLLAQCYQNNEAPDDAIRQYRRVIKEGDDRFLPDALLNLATLLHRRGDLDEAGKLLDRFLERFQESPLRAAGLLRRGRVWFDQREYDRAREMFEQVEGTKESRADEAAYWAAKCSLRAGAFEDAAERLDRTIERFPDSELLGEMMYDRGVAYVRAGEDDRAVQALETFRSRFPDHELAPDTLQLLAVTELERKNYARSLRLGDEFLDRFETHAHAPSISFLNAESEFLAGDYDAAVERYRTYLSRYADDAQTDTARYRLGTSLFRLERFDEAGQYFAEVVDGRKTPEAFRSALLALGDIEFHRSEWKTAEQHLVDYLASGASVASADDALLKLGLCRQRQGRYDAAIEAYDRLLTEFGDSPHRIQALFERGQAMVALDRFDEAKEAFEHVLTVDESSRFAPFALNHLGTIATRRKEFQEAARLFEQASASASRSDDAGGAGKVLGAEAAFERGHALMAAQQFSEAEQVFGQFLDRHAAHSRAPEARARRAITIARQDRFEDAVNAIEDAERRGGSTLEPSLNAALVYERAWCLRELGRLEGAAKAYRALLDEYAESEFRPHALLELSGLEFDAGRFEEAASLLQQLREIIHADEVRVPESLREQGTYRLAVCAFERERFPEASSLVDEFLDRFPNSALTASACYYGGESQYQLGRFEQAVKLLSRVAEDYRDDPVAPASYLRLGESLASLQHWSKSERVFSEFLEESADAPQWYQAQFGVGWARENQKRYDEAIRAYEGVVRRHQGPTAARAQFQIGECLFAQGKYDEAVRALLKVDILYAYPEWCAAALYEAGRCFEKLGKAAEARTQYGQVSDKYGQTRWAQLAAQRLSESASSAVPLPGR